DIFSKTLFIGLGDADKNLPSFKTWIDLLKQQSRQLDLRCLAITPKEPTKKYEDILSEAGFEPPASNTGNQYWTIDLTRQEMRSSTAMQPADHQILQMDLRSYFYEKGIQSFDEITEEDLRKIKQRYSAVWMMGLCKKSPASLE